MPAGGGHNQREKQSLQAEQHCIASSFRPWVCLPTRSNLPGAWVFTKLDPPGDSKLCRERAGGEGGSKKTRGAIRYVGCHSVCATSHSHENQSRGPSCQPSSPKVTSMKQSQSVGGETFRKKKSEKTQPDSSDILLQAPCRSHKWQFSAGRESVPHEIFVDVFRHF